MSDLTNRIDVSEYEADQAAKERGAIEKRISFFPARPDWRGGIIRNDKCHAHYFDANGLEIFMYSYTLRTCTVHDYGGAGRQWSHENLERSEKEEHF